MCVHVVYGTCVVLGIPDGFPSGPMSDGSIRGIACSIRESWRKKVLFVSENLPGRYSFFPPNKQADYPFDKQGKKSYLAPRALIRAELQELRPVSAVGSQTLSNGL